MKANSLVALDDVALWYERDISHSSVERVIMPDSTILADYALNRLRRLLANLVVSPERMQENLDRSYGLYFSQRVLTALIDAGHPRQASYVAVQKLADSSVDFLVRIWVKVADYWPVQFDLTEQIYTELPKAGIQFPFPQMDVHVHQSGS